MDMLMMKVRFLLGLWMLIIAQFAFADHHQNQSMADKIIVSQAWARATFALAKTGAAYINLKNDSPTAVTLLSANVLGDFANSIEIHQTLMQDDVMQMRPITEGIAISGGKTLAMKPGGTHFMLLGLKTGLKDGETIQVQLVFSDESIKNVNFPIKDAR